MKFTVKVSGEAQKVGCPLTNNMAILVIMSGSVYLTHSHSVMKSTSFYKRPIEEVTVVGDIDTWLDLSHVREPANEKLFLQGLAVKINQITSLR